LANCVSRVVEIDSEAQTGQGRRPAVRCAETLLVSVARSWDVVEGQAVLPLRGAWHETERRLQWSTEDSGPTAEVGVGQTADIGERLGAGRTANIGEEA
jgi:hypothetical protein